MAPIGDIRDVINNKVVNNTIIANKITRLKGVIALNLLGDMVMGHKLIRKYQYIKK